MHRFADSRATDRADRSRREESLRSTSGHGARRPARTAAAARHDRGANQRRGSPLCRSGVLIADAVRSASGRVLVLSRVTRLRSRQSEGPSAAHPTGAARTWRRAALSRRTALKAARRRQREKRRGVRGRGGLVAFIRAVMLPGRGSSCAAASTTLTAAEGGRGANGAAFFRAPTRRRDARGLLDVWPSGPGALARRHTHE